MFNNTIPPPLVIKMVDEKDCFIGRKQGVPQGYVLGPWFSHVKVHPRYLCNLLSYCVEGRLSVGVFFRFDSTAPSLTRKQ